jgi:hypothetical protein
MEEEYVTAVSVRCGVFYMCIMWRYEYVVFNDLSHEKEGLRYLVRRYGMECINLVLSLLWSVL